MKVYFGASTADFKKYQDEYFKIRDSIVDMGHVIVRDWIQIHKDGLKNNPKSLQKTKADAELVHKKIIAAFYKSEILIIENTIPSFSNGLLTSLAMQRKIPVLILLNKSRQKRYTKHSFIDGISSSDIQIKEYTKTNIEEVLNVFFSNFSDYKKKYRFHLVLDGVERRYLEWAKNEYAKSQTQLIKEAIRTIANNDDKYQDYLGK